MSDREQLLAELRAAHDEIRVELRRHAKAVAEARDVLDDAMDARDDAMRDARRLGLAHSEIADLVGTSRPQASKIIGTIEIAGPAKKLDELQRRERRQ